MPQKTSFGQTQRVAKTLLELWKVAEQLVAKPNLQLSEKLKNYKNIVEFEPV